MKDRFFIDTNILVYSLLKNDSQKHSQTVHLMESLKGNFIFISTQVLNELYVSLQKHDIDEPEIENKIRKIIGIYNISIINISTIKLCWKVRQKIFLFLLGQPYHCSSIGEQLYNPLHRRYAGRAGYRR